MKITDLSIESKNIQIQTLSENEALKVIGGAEYKSANKPVYPWKPSFAVPCLGAYGKRLSTNSSTGAL